MSAAAAAAAAGELKGILRININLQSSKTTIIEGGTPESALFHYSSKTIFNK